MDTEFEKKYGFDGYVVSDSDAVEFLNSKRHGG